MFEHGTTLYAFYTPEGEFMGLATYMSSDGLPVSLKSAIKENYQGYWITDLFHYSINNTPGYFITLENADRKIMLKAEQNKSWSFYSEVKKAKTFIRRIQIRFSTEQFSRKALRVAFLLPAFKYNLTLPGANKWPGRVIKMSV